MSEVNGDAPAYGAGEKVHAVVEHVFRLRARDPQLALLLTTARLIKRPLRNALPPAHESEAWDQLLALLVGVALNLVSDGVEIDVEQAKEAGAVALAELWT